MQKFLSSAFFISRADIRLLSVMFRTGIIRVSFGDYIEKCYICPVKNIRTVRKWEKESWRNLPIWRNIRMYSNIRIRRLRIRLVR